MVAHDWETMGACVTDDVVRVGPYGDTYRGRADYVAFIATLLPTLPGYRMDVSRVVYADGGRVATAELSETIDAPSGPLRTPESLVFDIDGINGINGIDGGLIGHIAIYIQRQGEQ